MYVAGGAIVKGRDGLLRVCDRFGHVLGSTTSLDAAIKFAALKKVSAYLTDPFDFDGWLIWNEVPIPPKRKERPWWGV